MTWQIKMIFVTASLVGFTLMLSFMIKNYNFRADTTLVLWLVGTTVGSFVFMHSEARAQMFNPCVLFPVLFVLIAGLTAGTLLNLGIGRILPTAPNPAMPMSMLNSAAAFVYLIAPLAAYLAPKYFTDVEFSMRGLTGVALVLIGCWLVST